MVFNLQEMDLAIIRYKTEIPHSGAKGQGMEKVGEGEHRKKLVEVTGWESGLTNSDSVPPLTSL